MPGGGSPGRPRRDDAPPAARTVVEAAPPPTEARAGDEDERNLSAELHAALGDLARCVDEDAADTLPARVEIRVRAHVSSTGVVTRSQVRAPALPEEARRCAAARAESARIRSPVPGAPRAVETTLILARRSR